MLLNSLSEWLSESIKLFIQELARAVFTSKTFSFIFEYLKVFRILELFESFNFT